MSTGLDRLDREFSLLVRTRANWKCARCGGDFSTRRDDLHCSHFHSRRNKATRFDPENAAALCWQCHWYLDHHPNAHKIWKLKRLGETRYEALAKRANTIVRLDLERVREWIKGEMRIDAAKEVDCADRLPEIYAKLEGHTPGDFGASGRRCEGSPHYPDCRRSGLFIDDSLPEHFR